MATKKPPAGMPKEIANKIAKPPKGGPKHSKKGKAGKYVKA